MVERRSPKPKAVGSIPSTPANNESMKMTKISPAQFVREVRQEANKISWPTRPETIMSGVMVLIMSAIAAVFFVAADTLISRVVGLIL